MPLSLQRQIALIIRVCVLSGWTPSCRTRLRLCWRTPLGRRFFLAAAGAIRTHDCHLLATLRQLQGQRLAGCQCSSIGHDMASLAPGDGITTRQGIFGIQRAQASHQIFQFALATLLRTLRTLDQVTPQLRQALSMPFGIRHSVGEPCL